MTHIELGWHLARLEEEVLPAIRYYQAIYRQCSDAFRSLHNQATLSDILKVAHQMPKESIVRLRNKYRDSIAKHSAYEVIGKTYCQNPIPLPVGKPQDFIDLKCVILTYILPELIG